MKEVPRISYTKKQWRVHKRRQLRAVQKAFEAYRWGCAYCPGWEDTIEIGLSLDKLHDKLSAKSWGH